MNINTTDRHLKNDVHASALISYLREHEEELSIEHSYLYFDFPVFKDIDGDIVISQIMLVSRYHGIIVISTTPANDGAGLVADLKTIVPESEHIFSLLYTRLLRNKELRKNRRDLKFSIESFVYAPLVTDSNKLKEAGDSEIIYNYPGLNRYFDEHKVDDIEDAVFTDLIATIEGAKGIIKPKLRENTLPGSKGDIANRLESEIAGFDQHQKNGYMSVVDGVERIRGLAGSGKTVVLAMKAALMHLRKPNARIAYTFYTRSLYQHIKRLITRFYRQFDDKDPDWSKLSIVHAWGGVNTPGLYYNLCIENGVIPLNYGDALRAGKSASTAFDFVCSDFLSKTKPNKKYDYIFIDEGQDFPASFMRLCVNATNNQRIVWAYDDLQTIFQVKAPSTNDIFGVDKKGNSNVELMEDIILYKCYRNPREILVAAHALGFGIYSKRIVQMLENKEHWQDIGYKVVAGEFKQGEKVVIERPAENSLSSSSQFFPPNEIVQALSFDIFDEEVNFVHESIKRDIEQGLKPDDILALVVDDRHAQGYLNTLEAMLADSGIRSNNVHADSYGVRDFQMEGRVTLSTIHKAKGNEAFMVYVLGVDALFTTIPTISERNRLFTALTRAKGWVRISGVGAGASLCEQEIKKALENYPNLVFDYPNEAVLRVMKRDLKDSAIRKSKLEKKLDEILGDISPEELQRLIEQRSIKKG